MNFPYINITLSKTLLHSEVVYTRECINYSIMCPVLRRDHRIRMTPTMTDKVDQMIPRFRSAGVIIIAALISISLTACGQFDSGGDSIYQTQALASGRILFAGSSAGTEGTDTGLYTVEGFAGTSTALYASANLDFTGPSVSEYPDLYWIMSFGKTHIELLNTFNTDRETIIGLGAQQRSLAFDTFSPVRFAFMDGSPSAGFNIAVQTSLTAQPSHVTSGASESVSYWTPAWSPDGEWIVYARISGTDTFSGELWRVKPDGSGAELLPITTTELPTYAVFSPDGTEILVPGDFTSYKIDDGRVGKIDHIRDMSTFQDQLAAMGYELVGSPVTGAVHTGDVTTSFRHSFPISAVWASGDWIYFDALVATNYGPVPHAVKGVGIFAWKRISQTLFMKVPPLPQSEELSDGYAFSNLHPTIIP